MKSNTDKKSMNRLKKNMWFMIVVFVLMFVSLIVYTSYEVTLHGQGWFASAYNTPRVQKQMQRITPGDIKDRNGLVMATSDDKNKRSYPQSEAARMASAHVMGDPGGITAGGAESKYSKYIYGFNLSMIDRTIQGFKAEKLKGDDIVLTVDSDLNKFIYEAMGDNTGAVVVTNYKTGEIVGSVSKKSFDPPGLEAMMKQGLPEGDDRLLNKANAGKYPPGSTMKLITTVAAFENLPDAESIVFDSPAKLMLNNSPITNYDSKAHGKINLKKGMEVSSNTYYAQLAKQIGGTNMTKTAQNFGFNEDFSFQDVVLYQSDYQPGTSDNQLAWSAVGQHQDLVTPLHNAMIAGAIANDGQMMEPKMLKDRKNSLDMSVYFFRSSKYKQATTQPTARKVKALMTNAVENGTGKGAKVPGATIGGKTGSAESVKDGKEVTHAWFVGFIDDENHPYAISIVLENAGTGGAKAAPVAGKVLGRLAK